MTLSLHPNVETIWRPSQRRIDIPPYGFVQYLDHMGTDETIVEAARTSTGKGFISWEPYKRCEDCGAVPSLMPNVPTYCREAGKSHTWKEFSRGDHGILEYMYKNRHETPAEMPVLRTLWKAPILTFRQLHRHRAASYNEQSARYMQLPNDFYTPRPEDVKRVSKTNKQGSGGPLPQRIVDGFLAQMTAEQQVWYERYGRAIADGIAPEMARMNMPVSMYSTCMVQMNLRMDLHMLGLRDDSHAQGITQQYAQAQAKFTQALFPRWYALYEEYTKHAVRLSRTEAQDLKTLLMELRDLGPGTKLSTEQAVLYKKLTETR